MSERERDPDPGPAEPANAAPDAVEDPNEKTEGRPGLGPQVAGQGGGQADEVDPGGS